MASNVMQEYIKMTQDEVAFTTTVTLSPVVKPVFGVITKLK